MMAGIKTTNRIEDLSPSKTARIAVSRFLALGVAIGYLYNRSVQFRSSKGMRVKKCLR
jgi:hypothetical protein